MRTKIDASLNAFVNDIAKQVLPARGYSIVEEGTDIAALLKRTGMIGVVEASDYPVFEDENTYYQFWAWFNLRKLETANIAHLFAVMAKDAIIVAGWSDDSVDHIDTVYGLVEAQNSYAQKFGKWPVDVRKFIKSYLGFGLNTVLKRDVY